jgi:hypothetical protein
VVEECASLDRSHIHATEFVGEPEVSTIANQTTKEHERMIPRTLWWTRIHYICILLSLTFTTYIALDAS